MNEKDKIENEYFEWLCDLVYDDSKNMDKKACKRLLIELHNTDFYFVLPMDRNRACDGVYLRRIFADKTGIYDENYVANIIDDPCSMLELLIGISIRVDETVECPIYKSFWLMMRNLDLEYMAYEGFDKDIFKKNIEKMLSRTYKKNGKGGLFVLKNCKSDVRDLEIWQQMQFFIAENLHF